MLRLALVAVLLAACSADDSGSIEIVKPAAGATISTADPIAFELKIHGDFNPGAADIYVDGTKVPASAVMGACLNHGGMSTVTWTPFGIANGLHDVEVVCIYDLGGLSDTVTLMFALP